MKYFKRQRERDLLTWKTSIHRKPLLLRGARQVGKTALVRIFSQQFKYFIEINFEQDKNVHRVFEGKNLDPFSLSEQISALYGIPIIPGQTLLFFDEIQSCLPAISSMRFFYEKRPDLHLIAAGSLLEFALKELPSFGVGRIGSMFLYPFSFEEFLIASNADLLHKAITKADPERPLNEAVHEKALEYYKKFLILGGMPAIVSAYLSGDADILSCQTLLDDLINTYEDDFAKYRKRFPASSVREVFRSVAYQNGTKFVYEKASSRLNRLQIKNALELLIMSGLIIPVTHTSANGIPLGAEVNLMKRKYLITDSGILQRLLGLKLSDILLESKFDLVNKGAMAELAVGLELLKSASYSQRQELYYWQREARNSQAEVDYLIQRNERIIPIEVKSGTKGSMQSLFIFLEEKKIKKGIRTSLENFSRYERIDIIPVYAISNLYRI
jgi:predicted AAA+ superfamily ATPase